MQACKNVASLVLGKREVNWMLLNQTNASQQFKPVQNEAIMHPSVAAPMANSGDYDRLSHTGIVTFTSLLLVVLPTQMSFDFIFEGFTCKTTFRL